MQDRPDADCSLVPQGIVKSPSSPLTRPTNRASVDANIVEASKPDAHADEWAVQNQVEVRRVGTRAEVDVGRESPVAHVGSEVVAAELPDIAVDADQLPG